MHLQLEQKTAIGQHRFCVCRARKACCWRLTCYDVSKTILFLRNKNWNDVIISSHPNKRKLTDMMQDFCPRCNVAVSNMRN